MKNQTTVTLLAMLLGAASAQLPPVEGPTPLPADPFSPLPPNNSGHQKKCDIYATNLTPGKKQSIFVEAEMLAHSPEWIFEANDAFNSEKCCQVLGGTCKKGVNYQPYPEICSKPWSGAGYLKYVGPTQKQDEDYAWKPLAPGALPLSSGDAYPFGLLTFDFAAMNSAQYFLQIMWNHDCRDPAHVATGDGIYSCKNDVWVQMDDEAPKRAANYLPGWNPLTKFYDAVSQTSPIASYMLSAGMHKLRIYGKTTTVRIDSIRIAVDKLQTAPISLITDQPRCYGEPGAVFTAPSALTVTGLQVDPVTQAPLAVQIFNIGIPVVVKATSTGQLPIQAITYTIAPALPAGLVLDPVSGSISGIPTKIDTVAKVYIITAKNPSGFLTSQFTAKVMMPSAPAVLTYPALTFDYESKISPVVPSVTGVVAAYTVTPALPDGLVMDALTGVISGKPTVGMPGTSTYTVTASNAGGMKSSDVSITLEIPPADRTIQMESFDRYFEYDSVKANVGGAYRLDVTADITPDLANPSNFFVTLADTEYLEFDVYVFQAGAYDISVKYAINNMFGKSMKVQVDGITKGKVANMYGTSGTIQKDTVIAYAAELSAGLHRIRITALLGPIIVDSFSLQNVPSTVPSDEKIWCVASKVPQIYGVQPNGVPNIDFADSSYKLDPVVKALGLDFMMIPQATLEFQFEGDSGHYDVKLNTLCEAFGAATYELYSGETLITVFMNNPPADLVEGTSNGPECSTLVPNVMLNEGDMIRIVTTLQSTHGYFLNVQTTCVEPKHISANSFPEEGSVNSWEVITVATNTKYMISDLAMSATFLAPKAPDMTAVIMEPSQTNAIKAMLQSERYSLGAPLEYTITSTPGWYVLRLYFAEFVQAGAGKRMFDVVVNGQVRESNFDIYVQAGFALNKGVTLEYKLQVKQGGSTYFAIIPKIGKAKLNGFTFGEFIPTVVVPTVPGSTTEAPALPECYDVQNDIYHDKVCCSKCPDATTEFAAWKSCVDKCPEVSAPTAEQVKTPSPATASGVAGAAIIGVLVIVSFFSKRQ